MSGPSLGLTTYTEQLAAYAGMIADLSDGKVIKTARNSEVSSEIPFGAVVVRDTDSLTPGTVVQNVKLPSTGGQRFYGVVVHSHNYENGPNGSLGLTGVKPDGALSIMRRGYIYANTEDAATEGNAAFVRYTANGVGKNPGNIRSDGDTSKADKAPGITFRTTTVVAGDLVLLEVDMMAYDAVKE